MRFKTSFFIDENTDDAINARSKQKNKTRSQVLQADLGLLYFCLDIGLEECQCSLSKQQIEDIRIACSKLTDEKAKTNFILSGYMRNDISHETREATKSLSKLSRIAILDQSEVNDK